MTPLQRLAAVCSSRARAHVRDSCAFRHAVLLCAPIALGLSRHVKRATASVLAQGGFTQESGRLMQQLLDLQELCMTCDVRDWIGIASLFITSLFMTRLVHTGLSTLPYSHHLPARCATTT